MVNLDVDGHTKNPTSPEILRKTQKNKIILKPK